MDRRSIWFSQLHAAKLPLLLLVDKSGFEMKTVGLVIWPLGVSTINTMSFTGKT